MNYLQKSFAIALLFFSVSCSNQSTEPEVVTDTPANSMEQNESALNIDISKLANQIDPICGMSVKSGVSDTATYNGKLYGFCSHECSVEFMKNPTAYLK